MCALRNTTTFTNIKTGSQNIPRPQQGPKLDGSPWENKGTVCGPPSSATRRRRRTSAEERCKKNPTGPVYSNRRRHLHLTLFILGFVFLNLELGPNNSTVPRYFIFEGNIIAHSGGREHCLRPCCIGQERKRGDAL